MNARMLVLDDMLESARYLYPFTSSQQLMEESQARLHSAIDEAERMAKEKRGYEEIAHFLCSLQISWTSAAILAVEILLSLWKKEDKTPDGT